MAGYIGTQAVSVNTTSATISDDLTVGDDATIDGTALVTGVLTTTAATVFNGGFAANDGSTITTADNTAQLTLISTDADASSGPLFNLYRNSGSPAAGDTLAQVTYTGENDADEVHTYANNFGVARAVGNGSESGQMLHYVSVAGSAVDVMRYGVGGDGEIGVIFNEGSADMDFRVESDSNTHALFVEGSSGNVIVGKDSTAIGTAGVAIGGAGFITITRSGETALNLNRTASDGEVLAIYRGGTLNGSIGILNANNLTISGTVADHGGLQFGTHAVLPMEANADCNGTVDLGADGSRWKQLLATNGSISTSDRNEKQDIAALTSAEMLVAKRISTLFKTFRWKNRVVEEGDDARTHSGIIAQDVQAAFEAESLDACDYSMFTIGTWWEHDVDVAAVEADDTVEPEEYTSAIRQNNTATLNPKN